MEKTIFFAYQGRNKDYSNENIDAINTAIEQFNRNMQEKNSLVRVYL